MAMLSLRNGDKDKDKHIPLPKAANVPPVPPSMPPRTHGDYAEEAKRAAQRYLDQVDEIDHLKREADEWRQRALLAEAEIKRLEAREKTLSATIEAKTERLIEERDGFRHTITVLAAQFHSASKILLDGFAAIEACGGPAAPKVRVDHESLAQQLDTKQDAEPEQPIPRVVAAGPAQHDDSELEPRKR